MVVECQNASQTTNLTQNQIPLPLDKSLMILHLWKGCGVQQSSFTNQSIVVILCTTNCTFPISPCQKWWQTILEIKVSCSQWDGLEYTNEGPILTFRGSKRYFFVYSLFPLCSHHVPIRFSKLPSCFSKHSQ
jgi:hypothetical protein